MAVTTDYNGYMLFFFENGKVAKIDMSSYETKTNRKKLSKAYSDKFPIVAAKYIEKDIELTLLSSANRALILNSASLIPKSSRDSMGVNVMTIKKNHRLISVKEHKEDDFEKPHRYRTKTLPSTGAVLRPEDKAEQLSLE